MLREIVEADGGYGDLGVVPTAPNPALKPKLKLKLDDECDSNSSKILNDECKKKKLKLKLKK